MLVDEKDSRKHLLVVGCGRKEYREDVLRALSESYRVHLLISERPSWQQEYLESFSVIPDFDQSELLRAAQGVCGAVPISGVLCWDEARVHAAAVLAEQIGMRGPGSGAVGNCRDKLGTRTRLSEVGVLQPKFAVVGSIEAALEVADEIGYPVVVKPRSAAASLGVTLVHDPAELSVGYAMAQGATIAGAPVHKLRVLVEEFVSGPEFSVDSAVIDGFPHPMIVAHKSVGFAPFFEETGHRVRSQDPLMGDSFLRSAIEQIHGALGFDCGWTHAEFKLRDGVPVLIEVNARIGGDMIATLARLACGLDVAKMAADLACGAFEFPAPSDHGGYRVAANRFIYADRDNVMVNAVAVRDDVAMQGLVRVVVLASPGDLLRLPPEGLFSGRAAVVIGAAGSDRALSRILSLAEDSVELDLVDVDLASMPDGR